MKWPQVVRYFAVTHALILWSQSFFIIQVRLSRSPCSWFEILSGPGRCIENKGGTGQNRVFVEMHAFYTWPGAWFAVLLLLSTSVACGAEAGVKDSWQKLFSRVFLASTSGYGVWNTPLPTPPCTPSTCSPHLRYSRLPPLEPPANSKQFLFPFRTFSISEFYPR